jgi:hypothetical protein
MDLPVICTLTPDTRATWKAALLPGLVRHAESREDTADGVRFKFSADTFSMLVSTVEAERQCCRFLRFDISIEPAGGSIWLSLSGPPGTRDFLAALLDS